MKRLLYLILKKDMIKRLKKYHGEQFIDDVMETFGIPTNFMRMYQKNISQQIDTTEIIDCANKLYYDINQNSKMDVPSVFYVRLEKEWVKWKEGGSELSFYKYCKSQLNQQQHDTITR